MRVGLLVLLILISVLLIILVLMQVRGSGVGAIFGGSGEVYRSRRGVEKILHYLTITLAFLFSAISFSLIFIK